MKNTFQKTFLAFAFLLVANFVMAQAPQGIPYQAVARDNAGNLIKNQNIALRFSIHDGTANGAVVYSETHSVTTDALGLFSVKIGGGTSSGTFANINWGSGAKFTQVALDVTGGSNFIDMGTTQMMSVPYALYAANANVPGVPGPQGPTGPTGATGSVGSVTAISGTSNANGATISGGNLTLTPASATNGGIVTNGTQTFAGNKTFTGTTTANSFVKTDGTASQYLMADGSTSVGMPSGIILPFAGSASAVPVGYLLCDGSEVSRTTFSNLFAILSVSWGSGNGNTTFNLPDLRGRFMRGVDGTAGNDPDAASRTAIKTGGNVGNNVGSVQADELKSHSHPIRSNPASAQFGSGPVFASINFANTTSNTTSLFGGTETRPKNVNVNYIIKI